MCVAWVLMSPLCSKSSQVFKVPVQGRRFKSGDLNRLRFLSRTARTLFEVRHLLTFCTGEEEESELRAKSQVLTPPDERKHPVVFHRAPSCGVLLLLGPPETPSPPALHSRVPPVSSLREEDSKAQSPWMPRLLCKAAFPFSGLVLPGAPCPGGHISVGRCLSESWHPFS